MVQVVADVSRVMAAFIALQRSIQREAFDAGLDDALGGGAALWAVEEAAAPLAASLRAHFGAGRPTDRADRPEWLFSTALGLARGLAPSLAPLQGAIAAHGLGGHYSAPLEFARALRAAVQASCCPDSCMPNPWKWLTCPCGRGCGARSDLAQ